MLAKMKSEAAATRAVAHGEKGIYRETHHSEPVLAGRNSWQIKRKPERHVKRVSD